MKRRRCTSQTGMRSWALEGLLLAAGGTRDKDVQQEKIKKCTNNLRRRPLPFSTASLFPPSSVSTCEEGLARCIFLFPFRSFLRDKEPLERELPRVPLVVFLRARLLSHLSILSSLDSVVIARIHRETTSRSSPVTPARVSVYFRLLVRKSSRSPLGEHLVILSDFVTASRFCIGSHSLCNLRKWKIHTAFNAAK